MSELLRTQHVQISQSSCYILLIEDDEATCEMLTECIEAESPFRVRTLGSGEEVLEHLQENRENIPSLFIIDYLLPGMNGLQLLNQLQSLKKLKQVPMIMITAATITSETQAALHDRNIVFLNKPFELSELLDCLELIRNTSIQQLL